MADTNINNNIQSNLLWVEYNINDNLANWDFWWWSWTIIDTYHRLDYDIRYHDNISHWNQIIPDNMNWILVWPYTISTDDEIIIWDNSFIYMIWDTE